MSELDKNVEAESQEKEVVSKNFIEQIIDKGLAEGVYDTVHTRFPPEPKRISAYRTCEEHYFELWTCQGIWR